MSRLKLYRPHEAELGQRFPADHNEPTILPFPSIARMRRHGAIDVVIRARVIHRNKRCPHCGYPVVEPLVLEDAKRSRDNQPIPGTGTLVGFHCHGCQAEWPL